MTASLLRDRVAQKREAIANSVAVIGRDSSTVKYAYNNGGFHDWVG